MFSVVPSVDHSVIKVLALQELRPSVRPIAVVIGWYLAALQLLSRVEINVYTSVH